MPFHTQGTPTHEHVFKLYPREPYLNWYFILPPMYGYMEVLEIICFVQIEKKSELKCSYYEG